MKCGCRKVHHCTLKGRCLGSLTTKSLREALTQRLECGVTICDPQGASTAPQSEEPLARTGSITLWLHNSHGRQ